jgi:O-antigen/teichoic acid export membrane protein
MTTAEPNGRITAGSNEPGGHKSGGGELKRDVLANLGGSIVSGVVSFATVPVLIHLVGLEEYGLVGFYATVQSIFGLIDSGFASTLNRQLAVSSGRGDSASRIRAIIFSLEIAYTVAAVACLVVVITAGAAVTWFPSSSVPQSKIKISLALMVLSVVCRMPIGFYSGGLLGIGQHIRVNVVNSLAVAGINALSLVAVWQISRSSEAYFAAQCAGCIVQICVLRSYLQSMLPEKVGRVKFEISILREVAPYTISVCGITLLGAFLKETDKIFLTSIVNLRDFAVYAIAVTMSSSLYRVATPLYNTIFPRLSSLSVKSDGNLELKYIQYAQIFAIGIIPAAMVICAFPAEILRLWTHSPETARNGWCILSILTIGVAINSVMHLPYSLQLAHGWTSLTLKVNAASLVLMIVIYAGFRGSMNALSVALTVTGFCVLFLFITIPLVHRRILKGLMGEWYTYGVVLPIIGAGAPVLVVFLAKKWIGCEWLSVVIAAIVSVVGCGTILPYPRRAVASILRTWLNAAVPRLRKEQADSKKFDE